MKTKKISITGMLGLGNGINELKFEFKPFFDSEKKKTVKREKFTYELLCHVLRPP